jgi:hypothetical protein
MSKIPLCYQYDWQETAFQFREPFVENCKVKYRSYYHCQKTGSLETPLLLLSRFTTQLELTIR